MSSLLSTESPIGRNTITAEGTVAQLGQALDLLTECWTMQDRIGEVDHWIGCVEEVAAELPGVSPVAEVLSCVRRAGVLRALPRLAIEQCAAARAWLSEIGA